MEFSLDNESIHFHLFQFAVSSGEVFMHFCNDLEEKKYHKEKSFVLKS